jgi:hypothetical protein
MMYSLRSDIWYVIIVMFPILEIIPSIKRSPENDKQETSMRMKVFTLNCERMSDIWIVTD